MVDFIKLSKRIKDSGMTMVSIASKSGITRETLYNRMNGVGEFTASEIVSLTKTLHLTRIERDDIFFSQKVELNDTFGKIEGQRKESKE